MTNQRGRPRPGSREGTLPRPASGASLGSSELVHAASPSPGSAPKLEAPTWRPPGEECVVRRLGEAISGGKVLLLTGTRT